MLSYYIYKLHDINIIFVTIFQPYCTKYNTPFTYPSLHHLAQHNISSNIDNQPI